MPLLGFRSTLRQYSASPAKPARSRGGMRGGPALVSVDMVRLKVDLVVILCIM